MPGILEVFDAPSIVFNCTQRARDDRAAAIAQAAQFGICSRAGDGLARRIEQRGRRRFAGAIAAGVFAVLGRATAAEETAPANSWPRNRPNMRGQADADERAWIDFANMLLASNAVFVPGVTLSDCLGIEIRGERP